MSKPFSLPNVSCQFLNTVEPPLTVTSLQRPLYFVPVDSPYIGSCLNLSTYDNAH